MESEILTLLKTLILIIIGGYVGKYLFEFMKFLEKKSILREDGATFAMETLYFAMLFTVPLSGNIILLLINIAILAFAAVHKFRSKKLPEEKPEDKVITKWFPSYP